MPAPQKVAQGKPLSASPLRSAGFVNDVVDAVSDYKQRAAGQAGSDTPSRISTDCLKVKNLTGQDLQRGHCVQLGEYLLDDTDGPDFRNLWFEGNEVADPVDKKWAILAVPLPQDKIGLAQLSGVGVAIVNVTSTSHRFATPVDGAIVLDSSDGGTAIEILSPLTETGEQTVAVRMGGGGLSLCGHDPESDLPTLADYPAFWRAVTTGEGEDAVTTYCLMRGEYTDDCCGTGG